MNQKPPSAKGEKGKKGKKVDDEKEKELMEYLKRHFFIDKFKDAVRDMIDMDPNLPKDPVKYIKNNMDYTKKQAREVERELKITRKAIAKFEEENAILKYQLQLYEPSATGSGSWSTTSRGEGEKQRNAGYDKGLKKKRDKAIEEFVKSEYQFMFYLVEYTKVLIVSWRGTYGTCLCGSGNKEPPIPEFLLRDIRPDTPTKEIVENLEEETAGEAETMDEMEFFGEAEFSEGEFEVKESGEEEDELEGEEEEEGEEQDEADREETIREIVEEEEVEEDIDDELPPSDDEPCTCMQDYMYPYPPDEYDFPLNADAPTD